MVGYGDEEVVYVLPYNRYITSNVLFLSFSFRIARSFRLFAVVVLVWDCDSMTRGGGYPEKSSGSKEYIDEDMTKDGLETNFLTERAEGVGCYHYNSLLCK